METADQQAHPMTSRQDGRRSLRRSVGDAYVHSGLLADMMMLMIFLTSFRPIFYDARKRLIVFFLYKLQRILSLEGEITSKNVFHIFTVVYR